MIEKELGQLYVQLHFNSIPYWGYSFQKITFPRFCIRAQKRLVRFPQWEKEKILWKNLSWYWNHKALQWLNCFSVNLANYFPVKLEAPVWHNKTNFRICAMNRGGIWIVIWHIKIIIYQDLSKKLELDGKTIQTYSILVSNAKFLIGLDNQLKILLFGMTFIRRYRRW